VTRLILATAVALLATGCGGDASPSVSEFSADAEAVCTEANARVQALGPEPPILTDDQARWVERVGTIGGGATADLRALEAPRADRDTIDAMLEAFDRGFVGAAAISEASRAGDGVAFRTAAGAALDQLEAGRSAASRYGLDACSRLGRAAPRIRP